MAIDIHGHIISPELLPETIFFKRLEIPLKWALDRYEEGFDFSRTVYFHYLSKFVDDKFDKVGDISHALDVITKHNRQSLVLTSKDMRGAGINKMVLLLLDLEVGYEKDDYLLRSEQVIRLVKDMDLEDRFIFFYGFDPRRKNAFNQFKRFYQNGWVKGVKLYPALGFSPVPYENPVSIASELHNLYNYCVDKEIPIIQHSSKGGIQGIGFEKALCHPSKWFDILFNYEGLKVCLAHSGGNDDFINYWNSGDNNWTSYLHKLLQEFENVYCDIAFHDSFRYDAYWDAFQNMLGDGFWADRILWGSDYPLHLFQYSYKELVLKWKENEYIWNLMQDNNKRFLGL